MADHRGTVGRAVVGKIKILDENDQELPAGQIGTVYFADAPVFAYHNDPEKTKRAYNAKGWSTLGDVGYLDDEGFLYLTDRKSYMIISGGVNIYPQETEDVLITHPGVADVAVFGVPNEEMGEEVKAVVQPHDMAKAGKELEAELILFCRKHLSPIKCPKSIDFEAELPRTPTGKLVKRHCATSIGRRRWRGCEVVTARSSPVAAEACHSQQCDTRMSARLLPRETGHHSLGSSRASRVERVPARGDGDRRGLTRPNRPPSPISPFPPASAPASSKASTACACMCWKRATRPAAGPACCCCTAFPNSPLAGAR